MAERKPTVMNPAQSVAAVEGDDEGRVSREVTTADRREVTVSFEALEDAFENNAPEVHSYLHLDSGEVIRLVDGIAENEFHQRVGSDPNYLLVDPVSSREQYRWMEKFISLVEAVDLRAKLAQSIDGKGAFRRFKDVLAAYPEERERWFLFRSERLRENMDVWLGSHHLRAVARPRPPAPVTPELSSDDAGKPRRAGVFDVYRQRLRELVEIVPGRELEHAVAFMEFLRERRRLVPADSSEYVLDNDSSETEIEPAGPPPSEAVQRANEVLEARLRGRNTDE